MPTYEYECQGCGHEFEREQRITDAPVKTCPKCRKRRVRRLISQTSFVLKGGGWYSDLYSSGKPKQDGDTGDKGAPAAGSDAKTDSAPAAKSDSKSDSKSDPKPDSPSGGGSVPKSGSSKGKSKGGKAQAAA